MQYDHSTPLETESVYIRNLRPDDLERVVALDANIVGRRRDAYFELKLDMAMKDTGVQISLAGEVDGVFAGFLIARVFQGEYGIMEPVANLEVFGVHPDFRGRGVGRALVNQLSTNLQGLRVRTIRTEVDWDDQQNMAFFHHEGFMPAPRICLDLDCEAHARKQELAV